MDACYRVVIYKDSVYSWAHNIVKNNIFYKGDRQVIYAGAVAGWEHLLHDNLWDNNIIFESDGGVFPVIPPPIGFQYDGSLLIIGMCL